MTPTTKMRVHVVFAALTGLALRLFFILRFPMTTSDDSQFYIELAWNWLKKGVYGFPVNGQLTPLDMRMPGYPAFLAAIFTFTAISPRAVMLAQAAVDLACCFLIARIAERLAPSGQARRAFLAALWLAALCPFTANYSAVVLFFTALAILVLLETDLGPRLAAAPVPARYRSFSNPWLLAGIVVGFGTLVRPDTPLLLVAAAIVLGLKWLRPHDWPKLFRASAFLGLGLLMPLLPWAARNWRALHKVQFLAPRYGQLPGEFVPVGFNDWTNTWLWRFRDAYTVTWKLNDEEISPDDIPPSAFDTPAQRERVGKLFEQYNDTLTVDPELDGQFREIAEERTRRHPLRTWVEIPFLRALTLWFTPRVELLPVSGHIFPLYKEWDEDRPDLVATLSFALLNAVYIVLALGGLWLARRRPGWALLVAFILVRTAFFSRFAEAPEPRYVIECFPALIALAAQPFARVLSSLPQARDESSGGKFAESVP